MIRSHAPIENDSPHSWSEMQMLLVCWRSGWDLPGYDLRPASVRDDDAVSAPERSALLARVELGFTFKIK